MRSIFNGEICGFGTTSGHRFVIGHWQRSPLGTFSDVMHEAPDGQRTLIAPNTEVAAFVQQTYTFDRVQIQDVRASRTMDRLVVTSPTLVIDVRIGARSPIGRLLRLVPARLARSTGWCTVIDPIARLAMAGVRTRGTAGNHRREWYGATDAHRLVSVTCTLDGADLGAIADVWPPVRFGFSSTPRTPSIVAVTTTIEDPLRTS